MKKREELEYLIRTHFSSLPLSTADDSVTFRQENDSMSFMYAYDGPAYCRKKGYVGFRVSDSTLYVDGLYINDKLRKKGHGRKIVESLEAMAKQLKVKEVLVEKSTNNPFWQHFGYSQLPLKSGSVLYSWRKPISNNQ